MEVKSLMDQYKNIEHDFQPVFNEESKVLILGTFPSVKSRENFFYYGHPQNRFWSLMAMLTQEEKPVTIEEKKVLLLKHGIAIWDVIKTCDITGSSDSSITNVVPADLTTVLEKSKITKIYGNGGKAVSLYRKYSEKQTGLPIIPLPSSSPANAVYSLERLFGEWKQIQDEIK